MENKCECGCGQPVKSRFIKGHYSKLAYRLRGISENDWIQRTHPDCLNLNPESKCRRCKLKKQEIMDNV